ncbi:purine nucleoside phosphorylase [Babesia caballi]|uniref:Purine nucleoside phosphorylase n=1 Tax=Babesia caballi TaxID=5871 RepID=A0AAV4LLR1_BABCB|nr:purine nucleoside phosphorylase [Babesia caballi]
MPKTAVCPPGIMNKIGVPLDRIHPVALVVGDPPWLDKLASMADRKTFFSEYKTLRSMELEFGGQTFLALCFGFGSTNLHRMLVELGIFGVRCVLMIGNSVSLVPGRVPRKALCVTYAACRGEKVSSMEVDISFPAVAHPDAVRALRQAASELGFPVRLTRSLTRDCVYPPKVDRGHTLRDEMVQTGFELEDRDGSTFLVACSRRQMVAGIISCNETEPTTFHPETGAAIEDDDVVEARTQAMRIALRAAAKLCACPCSNHSRWEPTPRSGLSEEQVLEVFSQYECDDDVRRYPHVEGAVGRVELPDPRLPVRLDEAVHHSRVLRPAAALLLQARLDVVERQAHRDREPRADCAAGHGERRLVLDVGAQPLLRLVVGGQHGHVHRHRTRDGGRRALPQAADTLLLGDATHRADDAAVVLPLGGRQRKIRLHPHQREVGRVADEGAHRTAEEAHDALLVEGDCLRPLALLQVVADGTEQAESRRRVEHLPRARRVEPLVHCSQPFLFEHVSEQCDWRGLGLSRGGGELYPDLDHIDWLNTHRRHATGGTAKDEGEARLHNWPRGLRQEVQVVLIHWFAAHSLLITRWPCRVPRCYLKGHPLITVGDIYVIYSELRLVLRESRLSALPDPSP